MFEKWKRSVNDSKIFGALLTDLTKAFDCLDHELLIAKLNAYGFGLTALKLVQNYVSNRKQRTKTKTSRKIHVLSRVASYNEYFKKTYSCECVL